jgi:hypothetical protein
MNDLHRNELAPSKLGRESSVGQFRDQNLRGNANPKLAHDVALLGQPLGDMMITRFRMGSCVAPSTNPFGARTCSSFSRRVRRSMTPSWNY